MSKYLTLQGLEHLVSKIKDMFVQKEDGKGLSTNDYSTAEKDKLASLKNYDIATQQDAGLMGTLDKAKLDGIETKAEANIINQIKRNGTIINPSGKSINIVVPTKISELVNDNETMNKTQVQQMISSSNHITREIVESLPTKGKDNTIYMKGPVGDGDNLYEEFMYINNKWEKIGDTAPKIDLSGYLQKTEVESITTDEINSVIGQ